SKAEQAVPGLFQAVGDSAVLEPPFADEGLAADLDLLRCRRIDHVVVVRGDLVMQALWGMREQVSVLMNRAALHRHSVPDRGDGLVEPRRAIDNEEFGPTQPALDEVVQHSAPCLGALPAHALLIASSTFWPSTRTPRTTRSEIEVALRSSRTRTTVPSRIRRTIGSSASER